MPLIRPQPMPTARPMTKASSCGTPAATASWPMTTETRIMIAPTDRSMPAVRITSVCATPMMAMIVTCCMISDRLNGWKNRPPTIALKTRIDSASTIERHDRRGRVQEPLQPAQRAERAIARTKVEPSVRPPAVCGRAGSDIDGSPPRGGCGARRMPRAAIGLRPGSGRFGQDRRGSAPALGQRFLGGDRTRCPRPACR